jgi:hypothetical protein
VLLLLLLLCCCCCYCGDTLKAHQQPNRDVLGYLR